jgi:hypothetical protein
MAGEAGHQQPRRSADARCGNDHEDGGDRSLGGDHGRSSARYGEADVDGRDQGQRQRVDGRRVQLPEAERRCGLEDAEDRHLMELGWTVVRLMFDRAVSTGQRITLECQG